MIVNRIVELQAENVIFNIASSERNADFIEELVEDTKPDLNFEDYHFLIATAFRYPPPVPPEYAARFKPAFYPRNCLYASLEVRTSVYEFFYHWLLTWSHIKGLDTKVESRTHFQFEFNDKSLVDIRNHKDIDKLMDRHNYEPSQDFVRTLDKFDSILYPSCRDPEEGDNVATFNIKTLGKKILSEQTLQFHYVEEEMKCVVRLPVAGDVYTVRWQDVC